MCHKVYNIIDSLPIILLKKKKQDEETKLPNVSITFAKFCIYMPFKKAKFIV